MSLNYFSGFLFCFGFLGIVQLLNRLMLHKLLYVVPFVLRTFSLFFQVSTNLIQIDRNLLAKMLGISAPSSVISLMFNSAFKC